MTIELAVTLNAAADMVERRYSYRVVVPMTWKMEQVEAHAKLMLGVLDRQAHEGSEEEEGE